MSAGGAVGHDRDGEAEDSGQGGHPAGPAAPDLRRQAARRRPHSLGLQHPEGEHAAPRSASAGRHADLRQNSDWKDHHARGNLHFHFIQVLLRQPYFLNLIFNLSCHLQV